MPFGAHTFRVRQFSRIEADGSLQALFDGRDGWTQLGPSTLPDDCHGATGCPGHDAQGHRKVDAGQCNPAACGTVSREQRVDFRLREWLRA